MMLDLLAIVICHDCPLTALEKKYLKKTLVGETKKQLRKKITNAAVYILVTISDFNTKYTCKLCNHCAAYPSVGRIADHTNICRNTHYEKAIEI